MTATMWVSARSLSLSLPRLAQDLSRQMQEQMFAQSALDGPVALQCQVTVTKHRQGVFATRQPSLSDLARAIERCLTAIVFASPMQIVRLNCSKVYGEKAGIEVTVERLAAEDGKRPQDGASGQPSIIADGECDLSLEASVDGE